MTAIETLRLWDRLASLMPPNDAEEKQAGILFEEYLSNGFLRRTPYEMLGYTNAVMAEFYRRLSGFSSLESPVQRQPDSGWMADADFCYVNIRATGVNHVFGTFVHATKLLPVIRANAIHLAPFTDYNFEVIYAIRSVQTISRRVVDQVLANRGFSAEMQVRAFVQAAHMLGKAVGLDVEPYVGQYAITVMMEPQLFRWIKVDKDKDGALDFGMTNGEMMQPAAQERIVSEIRAIVERELTGNRLDSLEVLEGDSEETVSLKQQSYYQLLGTLIEAGYYPLPAHTAKGAGLPGYEGYQTEQDYARFEYRDAQGQPQKSNGNNLLTPFKFYERLRVNQLPDEGALPVRNEEALDYFTDIFKRWRDDFKFDFLCYDGVGQVFHAVVDGDENVPASDRPTPAMLQTWIQRAKSPGKGYVGHLAERDGHEIRQYADLGFDLITGSDVHFRVDRHLIEKSFATYDDLVVLNAGRASRHAIPFSLDTHNSGDPDAWGDPLVKRMGPQRMRLRHFISRFIACGEARRPKYEVMGTQDLSYGLYDSAIKDRNLNWVGDHQFNRCYHLLEDIYERYHDTLREALMVARHVDDTAAWWVMTAGEQALVPVVSLENAAHQPPSTIDITWPGFEEVAWQVRRHDFEHYSGVEETLDEWRLLVKGLPYLGFRLYVLERD